MDGFLALSWRCGYGIDPLLIVNIYWSKVRGAMATATNICPNYFSWQNRSCSPYLCLKWKAETGGVFEWVLHFLLDYKESMFVAGTLTAHWIRVSNVFMSSHQADMIRWCLDGVLFRRSLAMVLEMTWISQDKTKASYIFILRRTIILTHSDQWGG